MKRINAFVILLITTLFSISACSSHAQYNTSSSIYTSSSSNKSDSPYTSVTLTEEGAARVNAGINRQNAIKQRYAKYASWLKPKFIDEEPKNEVKAGDEVEENMTFEIYPSDLDILDKMFLIGRTKTSPASEQTIKNTNSLFEITTNISKEEISDYSLNGQISYINGSGNINHDAIQFDSIPYQELTEFTMTYTYIKKGTSAESSPYSCQPSFNITKVDNEAPKYNESGLSISLSYTKTGIELRSVLIDRISNKFTINDRSLTKTVMINKTDGEIEELRNAAITNAKLASDHHFEPFSIPFTVSTQNASTEELTCTVLLIDDIKPAVFKDGVQVETLHLEGGTDLQLPHKDVVNRGANALLLDEGYVVEDYIEGVTNLDFDVYLTYDSFTPYHVFDSNSGCLITEFSYNNVNRTILDNSTRFNWEVFEGSFYHNRSSAPCCCYTFDYYETSHNTSVKVNYYSENEEDYNNQNWKNYIIDDLLINSNNPFEELLIVSRVSRGIPNYSKIVIINLPNRNVEWFDAQLGWESAADTKFYYDLNTLDHKLFNLIYPISASNVYTNAAEYDKERLYYNETSDYEECFCFKVTKGNLKDAHYNYSLEQFKTEFNITY